MNNGAMLFIAIPLMPFFFFPSIAAHLNRKRNTRLFLVFNALLATMIAYGLYAMGEPGLPSIPTGGVLEWLIGWLILLGFALRKDRPRAEAVDEAVEIVPYDPLWPAAFEGEKHRLALTLSVSPGDIEHIGSTAVPGLESEPVIDVMLGVSSLSRAHAFLSRLGVLGYQNFGEAGLPGRIYLRLREERKIDLHVVERGGTHWKDNRALRELLRGDATLRERYAAAKRGACESGAGRRMAYEAARQPVLDELLVLARKR